MATYTDNGGSVNGSNKTFTYSFETIETTASNANSEVNVALNGVTQATNKYTVNTGPASITFNNTSVDSTVQESDGAPKTGVTVRVYRDTNLTTAKAVYAAGSSIRASDLNNNNEQVRFAIQEEKAQPIEAERIQDGTITTAKIKADNITSALIADDQINSEHYVDGSIDTAHIADSQVTTAKIADSNVTSAKIADGAIVNADLNASAAIAHSKLAAVPDGQVIVGNGSTVPTAVAISGDVTLANDGAVTIANNAVEIGMLGCEQTTITDSDSHVPTSGAVVDYVAAQLASVGGLTLIADEDNFPTSQLSSGLVISIKSVDGIVINGSGVSTTARTAGNGSDNVTINGFPSDLYNKTLSGSLGLMVSSTGSGHIYTYHKLLAKESDVEQLSQDINDFGNRYRITNGEPGSDNDQGDLVFDTNANKMKVYDGSSWGEVTSSGDFKYLFLCPAGGTGAPTLDGSIATYDLRESSNSGSAATVTSAAQLLVSINGVIQKANTGTSAPAEGFALVDSNTIIFGSNLASGDSVFIIQIGSAVSIPTPGDDTVTSAKIVDGTIVNADINASANIAGSKIADDSITEVKLDIHNAPSGTDKFLKYTSNGMEWAVPSYTTNTDTNTNVLAGGTITGDVIFDNATNSGHDMTWDMSDSALEFADNVKATFGADGDLAIVHTGSNSDITDSGGGDLRLITSTLRILNAAANETCAVFTQNGSVDLYYDNVKEFETKAGGVKLNGHSECAVNALGNVNSNPTFDFTVANYITMTLTGNVTVQNPTTESVGQSGSIIITQDGTGSRTCAWSSQFKWTGGTAPTLTTTAGAVDRIDYLVVAADTIHCVASLDVK